MNPNITMLSAPVVALLLVGMLSQGNALSCTMCTEASSDNDQLPLNFADCDSAQSIPCPSGITQCMTMTMQLRYDVEGAGDATIVQTQRACAPARLEEPNTRCLSDQEFEPISEAAKVGLQQMIPMGGDAPAITFQGLEGSICICDTDNCTPPVPTKGGATNVASSVVLLVASLFCVLVCKAL